jgi:hypothetical protein
MAGFCEQLEANNIDPDKFIDRLKHWISEDRNREELLMKFPEYRQHMEEDYLLDMLEKFLTKVERERIQKKIRDFSP